MHVQKRNRLLVKVFAILIFATNTPAFAAKIGPFQAGQPGDVISFAPITANASDVEKTVHNFENEIAQKGTAWIEQIKNSPYPQSSAGTTPEKLVWILAQIHSRLISHSLGDFWMSLTNSESPALGVYVLGIVASMKAGVPVDLSASDQQITDMVYQEAEDLLLGKSIVELGTFPTTDDLRQQIKWITRLHLLEPWSVVYRLKSLNEKQRARVLRITGIAAKTGSNSFRGELLTNREMVSTESGDRTYTVLKPRGLPPADGWPTIFFFHGISSNLLPDQNPYYLDFAQRAADEGYLVVLPLGAPQLMSNQLLWGRGSLAWLSPGLEITKQRTHHLLASITEKLEKQGLTNKNKIYAVGHSAGGFLLSELALESPISFQGLVIFSGGLSASVDPSQIQAPQKRVPIYLRMGSIDSHKPMADHLVNVFRKLGYTDDLSYEVVPNRGHDIKPDDDYPAILNAIEACAKNLR